MEEGEQADPIVVLKHNDSSFPVAGRKASAYRVEFRPFSTTSQQRAVSSCLGLLREWCKKEQTWTARCGPQFGVN